MKIHHSSIALLEQKGSMGFKIKNPAYTSMNAWLVSAGEYWRTSIIMLFSSWFNCFSSD